MGRGWRVRRERVVCDTDHGPHYLPPAPCRIHRHTERETTARTHPCAEMHLMHARACVYARAHTYAHIHAHTIFNAPASRINSAGLACIRKAHAVSRPPPCRPLQTRQTDNTKQALRVLCAWTKLDPSRFFAFFDGHFTLLQRSHNMHNTSRFSFLKITLFHAICTTHHLFPFSS